VRPKPVRSGRDFARDPFTEQQRRERLAVERQHHLPGAHVGSIAAFDGQCGVRFEW
jgi:hypothetical protein